MGTLRGNAREAALLEHRAMGLGETFFVDSVNGSDTNDGLQPLAALATIAAALDLCTASRGDNIVCLPGHNEGFGDAQLDLDVAGVTIVGLGRGTTTPRIDFDHANASINVKANNVSLVNFRLLPSVTAVLIGIDVEAAKTDTLLKNIEVLPGEDGAGVDEFALAIDIKAGCTRTKVDGLKIRQHASAAGCLAGVRLTGASDDVQIVNSDIVMTGAGVVAPINGITTLSTNVRIENCVLVTDAEPGIELLTGTTGVIRNVDIFSDLATIAAATVADGCAHFRVSYVEVGNESGAAVKTASADD